MKKIAAIRVIKLSRKQHKLPSANWIFWLNFLLAFSANNLLQDNASMFRVQITCLNPQAIGRDSIHDRHSFTPLVAEKELLFLRLQFGHLQSI